MDAKLGICYVWRSAWRLSTMLGRSSVPVSGLYEFAIGSPWMRTHMGQFLHVRYITVVYTQYIALSGLHRTSVRWQNRTSIGSRTSPASWSPPRLFPWLGNVWPSKFPKGWGYRSRLNQFERNKRLRLWTPTHPRPQGEDWVALAGAASRATPCLIATSSSLAENSFIPKLSPEAITTPPGGRPRTSTSFFSSSFDNPLAWALGSLFSLKPLLERRRRCRWLMPDVMNNLFLPTTCHFRHCLFCRSVVPRSACLWGVWWESWRGKVRSVRRVKVGIGIAESVPVCGRDDRWLERVDWRGKRRMK